MHIFHKFPSLQCCVITHTEQQKFWGREEYTGASAVWMRSGDVQLAREDSGAVSTGLELINGLGCAKKCEPLGSCASEAGVWSRHGGGWVTSREWEEQAG